MAKMPVTDCPAGPALDAAVATVRGWRIARWSDETDGGFQLVDESGDYVRPWSVDKDPRWRWSPSTNIAAAWDLVEDVWKVQGMSAQITLYENSKDCHCAFSREGKNMAGLNEVEVDAFADAVPLAIVRTYLKMHGVTDIITWNGDVIIKSMSGGMVWQEPPNLEVPDD